MIPWPRSTCMRIQPWKHNYEILWGLSGFKKCNHDVFSYQFSWQHGKIWFFFWLGINWSLQGNTSNTHAGKGCRVRTANQMSNTGCLLWNHNPQATVRLSQSGIVDTAWREAGRTLPWIQLVLQERPWKDSALTWKTTETSAEGPLSQLLRLARASRSTSASALHLETWL